MVYALCYIGLLGLDLHIDHYLFNFVILFNILFMIYVIMYVIHIGVYRCTVLYYCIFWA